MAFSIDIESWFDYTDFETEVRHPGSGEEFHIDLKIKTEFQGDHNVRLQLSQSSAKRLRDKLTAALHEAYLHQEFLLNGSLICVSKFTRHEYAAACHCDHVGTLKAARI